MHFIVWTVNIVLQILPYTTGAYYGETFDDDLDISIIRCFIAHPGDPDNASYWNDIVINIQLIMSFIIIAVFTSIIIIYSNFIDTSNVVLRDHTNDTISTVIWYPLAMLVAYVPSTVFAIYFNKYDAEHGHSMHHGVIIVDYLLASNAFYGVFLTLIYYIKTKQAIHEWYKIFRSILCIAQVDDDDTDIDASRNVSEVLMNPISRIN